MSALLGYLGVDQYGNRFKIDRHPRKELLQQLGRKHADKMFIDTKDGQSKHVGYVVSGLWITVYEVHEWTGGKEA
jgi:hypothetical protein